MANLQQLIADIMQIGQDTQKVNGNISMSASEIQSKSSLAASTLQGSQSGQYAGAALSTAIRSVGECSNTLNQLGRTCGDCINDLRTK